MPYKTTTLILVAFAWIYSMILEILDYKSRNNPIPDNVSDVYDSNSYIKWKKYSAELGLVSIFRECVTTSLLFAFIALNVHSKVLDFTVTDSSNVYTGIIAVIGFDILVSTIVSVIFSYINNMVIEQKYGFNKRTLKTFVSDSIKDLIIEFAVTCGLLCLFALIHRAMGNWIILLFTVIATVLVLFISFLYPKLSRIYSKFTPLEDGELKTKLNDLLTKYGYKVRAIEVMDASKRTTKSNAYFTGYGKLKTIVLYDTLIQSMNTDEICAVFAHELGHGLHKDTLKNGIRSFFLIATMVLGAWALVSFPEIYTDFGFSGLNYAYAFILLSVSVLPVLNPLISIISSGLSRKAEYKADAQAVKEGYGEALISALKKLSRENFSNLSPSPVIVALSYSHPTTSQRIEAIEKQLRK